MNGSERRNHMFIEKLFDVSWLFDIMLGLVKIWYYTNDNGLSRNKCKEVKALFT